MARLYRGFGKQTFAICDKQSAEHQAVIDAEVEVSLMHEEKGFEDLVLKNTTEDALSALCIANRLAATLCWQNIRTRQQPRMPLLANISAGQKETGDSPISWRSVMKPKYQSGSD